MDANQVVADLCAALTSPEIARAKPKDRGVPPGPGLYAWWCDEESLPGVPLRAIDGVGDRLVYVGIAPSRAGSRQTLRGRICGNHLRGNIASSTFRLSLAALLWQKEGWSLTRRGTSAVLVPEDNQALSAWQHEHLRVSWAVRANPWEVEPQVIKALSPPLNLAENRVHPYSWTLSEARQRLRSAALSAGAVGREGAT